MPYIKQGDRIEVDLLINEIGNRITAKGDLNYFICELVAQLILKDGGLGYTTVSNWIDGVHGAEKELTRRLLNPYEGVKIAENGDVKTFKILLDGLEASRHAG